MSLTTWYRGEVFEPGKYGLTRVISIAHEGAVLAHVNATWPEAEQTANVMTAAADLLAILKRLNGRLDGGTMAKLDPTGELRIQIDAALAKAGVA